MTNTRKNCYWQNIKNGQYYDKVIEELNERCSKRGEEFSFNVLQTRQEFKRYINVCRDLVIKVKTSSGITRFQEDKELGSWFGKLLPIISSMDNCQLQEAIESGRKAPETNGEEANPEDGHDDDIFEEEASPGSSSWSYDMTSNGKRKYVPTPASRKNLEDKLRVS